MATALPLPYDATSPFRARRFVEEFAVARALDGTASALCTIASELVTNAILHGAPPIELSIRHQDGDVTIEVTDGDPEIDKVRPRTPDQAEPTGRGLRIVASLADRWGIRELQSGKAVWAATTGATRPTGTAHQRTVLP